MRDINRIHEILSKIEVLWKKYPDIRLGQLLSNIGTNPAVLYYIEDDALIKSLESVYNVDLSKVENEELKGFSVTSTIKKCSDKVLPENKDRIYIHNQEGKVKAVFEPDLKSFLDNGWKLGRKEKINN